MTELHRVEHFFRHEYGRLVAVLSCRVGLQHLEDVEDAAQSALLTALETWPRNGEPENPSAWLFRVAQNHLLGTLRQANHRRHLLERHWNQANDASEPTRTAPLDQEIRDDTLRLLFVCCHPSIPIESQLVLALKTLCGFSIGEIASRLFLTEANAYKRLTRARNQLRKVHSPLAELTESECRKRLGAVQQVLYVLFTEGHLSSHPKQAIRKELCDESIRLTGLLAEHPIGQSPETFALMALLLLHRARVPSRQDPAGGLLLLEEQDRSQWDQQGIQQGLAWLGRSAQGTTISRYHAEAAIAAEHCLAPTFTSTRWDRVTHAYRILAQIAPSPVHRLNEAVAIAEWQNPEAGLALLLEEPPPTWLTDSYLWQAVLADLHRRSGNSSESAQHRERALAAAPNAAIRNLLQRRLAPTLTQA